MRHPTTFHRRPAMIALCTLLAAALAGCGSTISGETREPVRSASHDAHSSSPASVAPTGSGDSAVPPADAVRLADGDEIILAALAFSETAVVVPLGATLTFVNDDSVGHTVTEGERGFAVDDPRFDEPLPTGASIEVTFDEAGRYDVTCKPHPVMNLTVFVEG